MSRSDATTDTPHTDVGDPPNKKKPRIVRGRAALNQLLSLSKEEWPWLASGTVFLLIGSLMGLLYPQAVRMILDNALTEDADPALIDQAALFMAAIFAFQAVATALRAYIFNVTGERIVNKLRKRLYNRILSLDIGFFDARRTGELMNRLASDTAMLQSAASANVSMALRFGVSAIGGVALLFYTSSTLATLMMLVVPPIAIGAVWVGRIIRRIAKAAQDALAEASEVAEETFSGIRTVRSYTGEPREQARYGKAADRAFSLARRRARAGSIFMGSTSFAGYGAVAVVLWYGGQLVLEGALSVGDLTSFILYTLIVAFSLGALADLWASVMAALGATERVFGLLNQEPEIALIEGQSLSQVEGEIVFDQVSFRYPSRPDVEVLKSISFRIAPGEVVALVGPSGSGKSTIAALIQRFYDPDVGTITLDGVSLRDVSAKSLRENIGVVAQSPTLFSTSAGENIRYGRLDASDDEVREAARVANADEFIREFPEGYDTPVGERGVQLSGGQQQRVAIARAVLRNPQMLIFDEATSALDAESEHLVKEALDRLQSGRTTLIIAHRLSTVMNADRVLVIDNGRLIEAGSHAELVEADGLYRQLVERQFALSA